MLLALPLTLVVKSCALWSKERVHFTVNIRHIKTPLQMKYFRNLDQYVSITHTHSADQRSLFWHSLRDALWCKWLSDKSDTSCQHALNCSIWCLESSSALWTLPLGPAWKANLGQTSDTTYQIERELCVRMRMHFRRSVPMPSETGLIGRQETAGYFHISTSWSSMFSVFQKTSKSCRAECVCSGKQNYFCRTYWGLVI